MREILYDCLKIYTFYEHWSNEILTLFVVVSYIVTKTIQKLIAKFWSTVRIMCTMAIYETLNHHLSLFYSGFVGS